ncbi:mitochondrial import inner membrane translocase subunit TIM17-1-like [Hordeum vulgare subsp. vulgare]|uniref:Uncharacterized protein n=1 Tax=Hordeum vulgare subsp. vulgare TaxID=112509 RepID=A0A8I6X3H3_HORVV|nr:mitochondrial import inner membrane translocase subunit TIM17-1-like [Hordeum vulgare subsp. vulgare]KAI5007800.1 hypothetical protein ZWY2020_008848 [Hordeum vulgare]
MSASVSEKDLFDRDPCPGRIIDDAGSGFAIGAVGGSIYHFLKGLRNSPNGARINGGMQAVCMNGPRVGGSFAVWSTLYSTFNCTLVYVRQKEDPWNSIIAGASTGGFLSMRQGVKAVGRSALIGGCFFVLLEGIGLMAHRVAPQILPPLPADDPNMAATIPVGGGGFPGMPQPFVSPAEVVNSSSAGSWFGGLFGKEEKKPSGSAGMSEILESFETPSPPIPSFE